ncbi:MAG TPA: EamA family transporter [Solirubrobacteraceae bacterium]|nr:EamA family transporter [Solirubrobacteraceae bacterium]
MPARSSALLVLVAFIWGVNFVAIHVGLDHFPPLLFSALRFTLVAIPAVFFVKRPPVAWRYVAAVGFMLGVVKFGLVFISIDIGLPAGLASLAIQVQVLFTIFIAAIVLKERPRRDQLIGAGIAFAGLAAIGVDRAASAPILPFALIVAAALAWGVANILTRLAQAPDGLALLVWASLVPPLPLLALSLVFEGPGEVGDALAGIDPAGLAALLFVVGPSTLLGFGIWLTMLKRHSAASVTPFALLVPIFGMASAALALGERPSAVELIGGAVVLAGVAVSMRPGRRAPAAAPAASGAIPAAA